MNAMSIGEIPLILSRLSKVAIRRGSATLGIWVMGLVLFGVWNLMAVGAELEQKPGSPPVVVILNSYHPGEAWTDNELAGLLLTLRRADPGLVPIIEYLDTQRFPGPDYLTLLKVDGRWQVISKSFHTVTKDA